MDSITHALYKAVASADQDQRADRQADMANKRSWDCPGPGWFKVEEHTDDKLPRWAFRATLGGAAVPGDHGGGLQPLATRPEVLAVYKDVAAGTDLHIHLTGGGSELLALWLEMTAAGLDVPAGLVHDGADVVLSPGSVSIYVDGDDGVDLWHGYLHQDKDGRRMTWAGENI